MKRLMQAMLSVALVLVTAFTFYVDTASAQVASSSSKKNANLVPFAIVVDVLDPNTNPSIVLGKNLYAKIHATFLNASTSVDGSVEVSQVGGAQVPPGVQPCEGTPIVPRREPGKAPSFFECETKGGNVTFTNNSQTILFASIELK